MLSSANPNGIEDAGFSFIVGSRISTAPYDLAAHLQRHGNAFDDSQILESSRAMGAGKAARSRRVVYQYKFARHKRDDRAINAMVERAEKVAAGTRPLKKDRSCASTPRPRERLGSNGLGGGRLVRVRRPRVVDLDGGCGQEGVDIGRRHIPFRLPASS